jgi:hypothetical protein
MTEFSEPHPNNQTMLLAGVTTPDDPTALAAEDIETASSTSSAPFDETVQTMETAPESDDNEHSTRDNVVVSDLPEEVFAFLVRSSPRREMWKWLSQPERQELLYQSTRGFQRQAGALRQPSVRRRIEQYLVKDSAAFFSLIELWGGSIPEPHIITVVRELEEDSALIAQLPALWARHSGEALLLALLLENRGAALDAMTEVDPDVLVMEQDGDSATLASQGDALSNVNATKLDTVEDETSNLDGATETIILLQRELESARQSATAATNRSKRASDELSEMQARLSREVQAAQAKVTKEERRAQTAEQELAETRRQYERTSRRQRQAEREMEELQGDTKRLKKQLRQAQQLHEELRKQLNRAQSRLKELAPPELKASDLPPPLKTPLAPSAPLGAPPAPTPFDVMFEWKSDGRPFRVTPREVARAIDRNDEDFIFRLIQAFDDMRAQSEEYYRLFIKRMREINNYYARVLTAETTRVLVDASNVVRFETNHRGKGKLEYLLLMREELRRRDCFPILIYADASLPYFIDKPHELAEMARRGELMFVDKGVEADEILAREARRSGAYVVTNDRGFHLKVSPDFEPPRITFRILGHLLVVDDF